MNALLEDLGPNITIVTYRRDPARTFTRYLADVRLADGRDLATVLIESGHGARSSG